MIQQHPRLVATCKSQLIVSLVLSRPAAQPSPSAVPKSEDQRPQLGMCPGAPVAMREAAGWGGMFLKCPFLNETHAALSSSQQLLPMSIRDGTIRLLGQDDWGVG